MSLELLLSRRKATTFPVDFKVKSIFYLNKNNIENSNIIKNDCTHDCNCHCHCTDCKIDCANCDCDVDCFHCDVDD
jgi:hypothetical protein